MDSEPTQPARSELAETRRVNKFISIMDSWKDQLVRAKTVDITAPRNKATKFARSERLVEYKAARILKSAKSFIKTLREYHDTEIPRPQTGDIEYTINIGAFTISSLTPNPTDPYPDTIPSIRVRMNTDGINDVDLNVSLDRKLTLKVFFEKAFKEADVVYNSGDIRLDQSMNEEEVFVIEYALENARRALDDEKRQESIT